MRSLALALLLAALAAAPAQARSFEQAELDALLAPVALYPDELVNHILVAAAYPEQVSDAARGAPAQPHWHPSVVALGPYSEILQRMAESPQWMGELSQAFITQQASVMQAIQGLRSRAQAYGHVPEPQREVVYVRYYDPLVVYGGWWWPAHRPHFWRPWHSHRVFIQHNHHHRSHGHHHKHVDRHPVLPAPRHVHTPKRHHSHVKAPIRVPESQRRPIVSSTPQISQRQWRSPSYSREPQRSSGRHQKRPR